MITLFILGVLVSVFALALTLVGIPAQIVKIIERNGRASHSRRFSSHSASTHLRLPTSPSLARIYRSPHLSLASVCGVSRWCNTWCIESRDNLRSGVGRALHWPRSKIPADVRERITAVILVFDGQVLP